MLHIGKNKVRWKTVEIFISIKFINLLMEFLSGKQVLSVIYLRSTIIAHISLSDSWKFP